MPPSHKRGESSAPPTVYRSTGPTPKQQLFPGRKRSAKTYGKATTRSLKQETLTQMDFVGTPAGSAPELLLEDSQDDDDHFIELEPLPLPSTRQPRETKANKKARSARRVTAGESLEPPERKRDSKRRKTMGDTPTGSASSSFHTQTLTQFLSNHDSEEALDQGWHVTDSEAGGDAGFILETPQKNKPTAAAAVPEQLRAADLEAETAKLVTPSGRDRRTEIPSSQSPLTPMLLRYNPAAPHESPLRRKSSPLRPQTTPILKSARKTPRLQVEDTFATLESSPTTPTALSVAMTPRAGTAKRLRFEFEVDKENITPGRKKPKSPKAPRDTSGRKPLREVPDSDEELDDTTDEAESVSGAVEDRGTRDETPCPIAEDDSDATADPESCYGDLGAETQAQLLSSNLTSSHDLNRHPQKRANENLTPRRPRAAGSPSPRAPRLPQSSAQTSKVATPKRTKDGPAKDHETQFTPYTQGMESQRVPLDDIRALGPQTDRSDIMVSLHPEPLRHIIEGTKDHEFRAWKIPPEVSRVWLYATNPHSELRYMCILGPPKAPGEIENEKGLGNAEFNSGKKRFAKYAYEFIQIYELNNPVPLAEMIRKGWIRGAPQKYAFVPPAVVGELTANLRCALFGSDEETQQYPEFPASSQPLTESQELKAQLQSEGHYSTQSLPSEHDPAHEGREKSSPLRPDEEDQENMFAKPALPPSDKVDSDLQTPRPSRARYAATSSSLVRTSQATTISQLFSSPAPSPKKSQKSKETPSRQRRTRRSTRRQSQRSSQPSGPVVAHGEHTVVDIISSSSPVLPRILDHVPAGDGEEDSQEYRTIRTTTTTVAAARAQDDAGKEEEPESESGRTQSYPPSSSAAHFHSTGLMLPESLLGHDDDNDGPPPIIWDSADEQSD
ncbi:uncharacterized protein B0I36DRAFT_344365 [Microdochium trichocladiopsis]|uniref:Uncharacterized protein n=1 Tax=Microdochium trichocladiopsis TaxID=1682393 RepID=A0A9P8YKF8_9PEZI|nr:uncharacterized protein B0I36DRAFT_344365 [Microdochium trichocladiopsis]KAH7040660.1 hypothetical protein B0I36DRAFT_344365 [Microdochium trichocladiopsis]